MIPWRTLAEAPIPGETGTLVLLQRGDEFIVRRGAVALMGSTMHASEERLAEGACAAVAERSTIRVLIGGLGMGYTLAAALRALPPHAEVVVAELLPAVVEWNRGPARATRGTSPRGCPRARRDRGCA
jgi:spermidine synthase